MDAGRSPPACEESVDLEAEVPQLFSLDRALQPWSSESMHMRLEDMFLEGNLESLDRTLLSTSSTGFPTLPELTFEAAVTADMAVVEFIAAHGHKFLPVKGMREKLLGWLAGDAAAKPMQGELDAAANGKRLQAFAATAVARTIQMCKRGLEKVRTCEKTGDVAGQVRCFLDNMIDVVEYWSRPYAGKWEDTPARAAAELQVAPTHNQDASAASAAATSSAAPSEREARLAQRAAELPGTGYEDRYDAGYDAG